MDGPGRRSETDAPRWGIGRPLAIWAAIAGSLLILQHVSSQVLRGGYRWGRWEGWLYYVGAWSQFDGPEYLTIATEGYSYTEGVRSNVVWFPLYPMVLRAVRPLFGDPLVTGVVVSLVFGAAAAAVYWRWLAIAAMSRTAQVCAFLALAFYPYGWYLYGVVHSDSLFLLLVVAAFALVERDRLVWAGVIGALATATRPTGMALIPALVVAGLMRDGVLRVPDPAHGLVARFAAPVRVDAKRLRARSLAPAACVAGIGAFALHLWITFGHPLLFVVNQRTYHPSSMPLLKLGFVSRWLDFGDDPGYALTISGQAVCALVVAVSVPAVCRRFGFAYGLYCAVLVAIPTVSTADFMGTGRYLMAAFPVFALWGERLADGPKVLRVAVLGTSGLVMTVLSMLFARSVYLT